ncbi:hypothetical protein [Nocardia heshunensis]
MTDPSGQYCGCADGHTPLDGFTEPSGQYCGTADGQIPLRGFAEPSGQYSGWAEEQTPLAGLTEPSGQYSCFGVIGQVPQVGFSDPSGQYCGTGLSQAVPQPGVLGSLVMGPSWVPPPQSEQLYFGCTVGGFSVTDGTFTGAVYCGAEIGTVVIGTCWVASGLAQPTAAGVTSAMTAATRRNSRRVRGENLTARVGFACRSPPARRTEYGCVFIGVTPRLFDGKANRARRPVYRGNDHPR